MDSPRRKAGQGLITPQLKDAEIRGSIPVQSTKTWKVPLNGRQSGLNPEAAVSVGRSIRQPSSI